MSRAFSGCREQGAESRGQGSEKGREDEGRRTNKEQGAWGHGAQGEGHGAKSEERRARSRKKVRNAGAEFLISCQDRCFQPACGCCGETERISNPEFDLWPCSLVV